MMIVRLFLGAFIILSLLDIYTCPNVPVGKKLNRREKLINAIKTFFMGHSSLAALAKKMFDRRYFQAALNYYTKAIKQKSNVAEYYIQRGECNFELENKDGVVSDYRSAITYAADPTPYRIRLCRTLFDFERFEDVTMELKYLNEDELLKMANEMISQSRFREAIIIYDEVIRQKPDLAIYYIQRADCHLKLQNIDDVISDYKSAALSADNGTQYQILLCQTMFKYGRLEQVRIELKLLHHDELYTMAKDMASQSKFKEAIIVYDVAIEQYPHELYYRSRGFCHKSLKNKGMTLSDFREAAACQGEYADGRTRRMLIDMLLDDKNFEDAKDEMSFLEPQELVDQGDRYRFQNKFEEAYCFYSEAVIKYPHEKYYRLRGICCMEMGNLRKAIIDFTEAVSRPAEYSDNLTRVPLIEALLRDKKFDRATEEMTHVDDSQLAQLGDVFISQKKFKEAISFYTTLINRNPKEKFYQTRGVCHKNMGDLTAAISDFKKILKQPKNSGDNRTRLYLIETLILDKNFEEAIKEMAYLNESELIIQGNASKSRRQYEEAILYYTGAIKNSPSAKLYKLRANCYTEVGDLKNALLDFEKVIEHENNVNKSRKGKESQILLCTALFECGRYAQAEIEMNGFTVLQIFQLADQLFEKKMFDESFKCYSKAIAKEPHNSYCYEKRAQYHRKRGNHRPASYDYEKGLKINPSSVSCWISYVESLLELNDYISARRIFEHQRFLKLEPEYVDRVHKAEKKIRSMEEAEARRKREEEELLRRKRAEEQARRQREEEDRRRRQEQDRRRRQEEEEEAARRRRRRNSYGYGASAGFATYSYASACGGGGGGGCGGGCGGGGC